VAEQLFAFHEGLCYKESNCTPIRKYKQSCSLPIFLYRRVTLSKYYTLKFCLKIPRIMFFSLGWKYTYSPRNKQTGRARWFVGTLKHFLAFLSNIPSKFSNALGGRPMRPSIARFQVSEPVSVVFMTLPSLHTHRVRMYTHNIKKM